MDYSLKDSIMLYSAMIIACIGLLILFLIMFFYNPEEQKISEITDDMINKKISLTGKVSNMKYSQDNSTLVLKIIQECTIDVTIFDNAHEISDNIIINFSILNITGKLQEFNGRKSIIAEDIRIIR